MKIHFSVSEAQIEPHEETGIPPISPDQAALMTIDAGDLVQMTYNALRIGPDGHTIALYDEDTGFWGIVAELEPESLEDMYGKPHTETTKTSGMTFTDWTIAER